MADRDEYSEVSEWLRAAADTSGLATPLPLPGDVIAGKYKIEALIGRGGMGAVFRATHQDMDKPVALKWLLPTGRDDEELRKRMLREARVAARIRHPHVVDVYDVGKHESGVYLVMELLEGEPLQAVVERGELSIPDLLQLLIQAMWGVAAAHEQGIVHRDIKPDNIFVSPDPMQPTGCSVKVLDFGISKITDEQQTQSGVTMGTPAYMSLEQIQGARDVDARADIYSFGVLMYRALTGRLPFEADTVGAMAIKLATQDPPSPKELRPDLPEALDALVMKALARERGDRFESMQQLLEGLQSLSTTTGYLRHMSVASTTAPKLAPDSGVRRRSQGTRWLLGHKRAVFATALLLLVAIGAVLALQRDARTPGTDTQAGAPAPRKIVDSAPVPAQPKAATTPSAVQPEALPALGSTGVQQPAMQAAPTEVAPTEAAPRAAKETGPAATDAPSPNLEARPRARHRPRAKTKSVTPPMTQHRSGGLQRDEFGPRPPTLPAPGADP